MTTDRTDRAQGAIVETTGAPAGPTGVGALSDLATPLTAARMSALEDVCDTLVPSCDSTEPGPVGDLLRLGARERGSARAVAGAWDGLSLHVVRGIAALLDGLQNRGFAAADLSVRTAMLAEVEGLNRMERFGLRALKGLVLAPIFSSPGGGAPSPAWEAIGYPGPVSAPPREVDAPKTLPVVDMRGRDVRLTADVCIVGSGAGGSVIAARLAQAGATVLVLEMGPYKNEADFDQTDASASDMYLGGGLVWSEGGEIGILSGSALGGGTVINSMVCLPTPPAIRSLWAGMGLGGLDGPEYDTWTATVWDRLNVNTEATVFSENTRRMVEGITARGYGHEALPRNVSLEDRPELCGYCNWGCQQGCKRSTTKTYLEDAADAGARFVVGCEVQRVTSEDGRATGVDAVVRHAGGTTRLRVDAPTVVVAGGGVESPALLLRSQIGGPAVGDHLHLHPGWFVSGVYDDPIEAWNGQIQSAATFDLTSCVDGYGFLIETVGLNPAFWASASPFTDGRKHREDMTKLPNVASWHAITHDRGHGRVVLDERGGALIRWRLDDDVDRRVAVRAHVELARMHHAAGAREIFTFHAGERRWRTGEDFEAFVERLERTPVELLAAFSAHQMGSCRMGADPEDSVADGLGQLHDTRGVWIGDGSALPTAPGVNPMITIMALAERTAEAMIRDLRPAG